MRFYVSLYVFLAVFGLASQAAEVSEHEVNGFKVYLVDTQYGNSVAITTRVFVGSWHDDPIRHAGRAHLWEHVIHLGSEKFPGNEAFDKAVQRMDAETNAWTAHDHIFYFLKIHPSFTQEAIELQGALISAPEWHEGNFLKEKETVKNEALEYQKTDGEAARSMTFLHLTPAGHPLQMYPVGTQDQLDAMTLEDLKELYYSNYTPESMAVVIAGNFSRDEKDSFYVSKSQVLAWVEQNYRPARILKDPTRYQLDASVKPLIKKEFPSVIDPKSERRLIEIQSKKEEQILMMAFELPESSHGENSPSLETLVDYLNFSDPGTLSHVLRTKGWIHQMGVSTQDANNLHLLQVYFVLTEEGAKHREEVQRLWFAYLGKIEREGFSDQTLEFLAQRNILSYQTVFQSAQKAAQYYGDFLQKKSSALKNLDLEKAYQKITSKDLVSRLKEISEHQTLVTYQGPEVKGNLFDSTFDRFYQIKRVDPILWGDARRKTEVDFGKLEIAKVPLVFKNTPYSRRDISLRKLAPIHSPDGEIYIRENHQSTEGGVQIQVQLPLRNFGEKLSMATADWLYLKAFYEAYRPEIQYLHGLNLFPSIDLDGYNLTLSAAGNSSAALSAVYWMAQKFAAFKLTEEGFQKAKALLSLEVQSSQDEFTATIARSTAHSLLSQEKFSLEEMNEEAEKLDRLTTSHLTKSRLFHADFSGLYLGDYAPQETLEFQKSLRTLFPRPLSREQREKRIIKDLYLRTPVEYHEPLPPSKSETAYGVHRTYLGPEKLSLEHAAVLLLEHFLNKAVYHINRTEGQLGYVHGFGTGSSIRPSLSLIFIGQTETHENFPKIAEGWKKTMGLIESGELGKEDFEASKTALIRSYEILPSSLASELENIAYQINVYQDPEAQIKIIDLLKKVTHEDVISVGKKYLIDQNYLEVVTSKEAPCEGWFTSKKKARSAIRKKKKST